MYSSVTPSNMNVLTILEDKVLCSPAQPRTMRLLFAVASMDGAWLLEQPRSSVLPWHPRVSQLFRSVPKVG